MATLDVSIEQMFAMGQRSRFTVGSRDAYIPGYASPVYVTITNNDAGTIGVTASIWKNSGSPIFQCSVNDGAWADVTAPSATTWTDATLPGADALPTGATKLGLRIKPGSTVNVSAMEYARVLTITYTTNAPTISIPSGMGTVYGIGCAPLAGCSAREGEWVRNTSLSALPGGQMWSIANPDTCIRWRGNHTDIKALIFTNSASTSWQLVVDGDITTSPAKASPTNSGSAEVITIATGLSGTHEFELFGSQTGNGLFISDLILIGGTGLDTTYNPPRNRGRLFALGDSIPRGETGFSNSTRSWVNRIGHYTNRAIYNRGVSSNPLVSTFSTQGGQDRWHQVTMFGIGADDVLIINLGTNDANVASPDQAAIQRSAEFLLDQVTGQFTFPGPYQKVIVVGLIPYASGNLGTNYAATNASLAAAVAANGHSSLEFTNPATWSNPAFNVGTMLADTTHPNTTGSDCYYTNIRDLVPAWSAASSGVVGVIGE